MLIANLPDPSTPNNPSKATRRRKPTASHDEVAFIRTNIETMPDTEIAKALGWGVWKVLDVRQRHDIPAHNKGGFWTDERVNIAKPRCEAGGETYVAIAKDIGCSAIALRRKADREGWGQARVKVTAPTKTPSLSKQVEAPRAPVVLRPYQLQYAPIVFAAPRTETETLGDRMLRELSAKPLSAASLATLLGEKELLVSMQLSAFAHEGRVEAGPVGERGLRYRVWSVVDQSSSVANSAASLRCGPDSLVVAGEAA